MSRIHVLDEHLTNMIAAGEVVEKPMGVVKELVENSIDAQATRIIVRVVNGGRDMIEVSDDGIGMDQEDAVRAFSRHATSKILRPEDLWDIHTMGFRGEALPSIASVSKTSLLTSDGNQSTEIILEYGKIIKAGPAASARGTTVRVENLFLKTPARLKHLKSGNTEFNAIIDLMQKFALGNPQIAFELYADDKLKLQTPGNGSLDETMMHIYGLETAKNSIPVEFSDYDFSVRGVLVLPSINRSTKQYINCFINGRIVRSFLIQKAIIDAYREFMMPDRYPVCVLNIDVDYQLVDVNVHPSKWEIRLSKERQLCSLIQTSINEILKKQFKPGEIRLPKQNVRIEEKPLFETTYTEVRHDDVLQEKTEEYVPAERKEEPAVVVERFQYLAQLHGNYILACDEDNLYIVDQHAAMERCMYEDIQQEIEKNDVMTQDLIVPLMIELTPAEIQQIDRLNEVFNAIGVEMEGFSSNSVLIRRVPLWFEDINEEEFIHDLVGEILNEKKMNVLDIRKDRIASLACHSSIKFNHRLDAMESRKLLSRLGRCVQPFNCPHGRPTMMAISEAQLQKEFKRVL
ncbi:MAG: DNA mismatch repair endonuclease MutL [Erysipelotrichaceae bacterium]|nr:DNA mismatch repair endonuclease MutL [Erysipelotrichaceae bacterium]